MHRAFRPSGVVAALAAGAAVLSGSIAPAAGAGGFGDVGSDAYYSDAVEWLADEGITTGTSPGCFTPEGEVSRGQFATFLHRYEGEPKGVPAHDFSDVADDAFYAAAVGWLSATGLTTGTSPTTFSPDLELSRAHIATFLWRHAGRPDAPDADFVDVPDGRYFTEAVDWMLEQGITTGTSPTEFSPERIITRKEFAAMLWRYAGQPDPGPHAGGFCDMSDETSSSEPPVDDLWAFEETFDGIPAAPARPSDAFDYAVTHRTHPKDHPTFSGSFEAEHSEACAAPPATHWVVTSSNARADDESIYRCKNHQMTAMGDVEGYSMISWWPRQEFDFTDGGVLELDVNPTVLGSRLWWEVVIAPRGDFRFAAAESFLPIDETYPDQHVVFRYRDGHLSIEVDGAVCSDWRQFGTSDLGNAGDPAVADTKVRRTFRLIVGADGVPSMEVELDDGSFARLDFGRGACADVARAEVSFTRGIPVFSHHAYTPDKDGGNAERYTLHWDNIRFDGPVVGEFSAHPIDELVYLQTNGSVPIGSRDSVSVEITDPATPVELVGQIHAPQQGQPLVSVNGGTPRPIAEWEGPERDCWAANWTSFSFELAAGELVAGANTFEFSVGPAGDCGQPEWQWDGFSLKSLELRTLARALSDG